MGIRKGFFLGFLAGAAINSLLSRSKRAEAPGLDQAAREGERPASPLRETLERIRRHADDAINAAHEAAEEKEAELRRRLYEATHNH
jgi:hypothetical protein